ncbi:MAG: lipid-A-disaccharide synthase [Elusimicrobia bacterium]|nr:lipid-A-disaccharide synthase [Elusimicrobiota bacterium]
MTQTLFISAGDFSGDILAGRLAETFIKNGWEVFGLGGEKLRESGAELTEEITRRSTIGFLEAAKNIFYFRKVLSKTRRKIKKRKPQAAVVIDFWGFHSFLIKILKTENIPVYYYVSPQVWASREGRVKKIRKFTDRVFVIFPFEKKFYEARGIEATYTGHPLAGIIPLPDYNPDSNLIGILPGSRRQEIKHLLPLMIETARGLGGKHKFVCFKPEWAERKLYGKIPQEWKLAEDENYELRKRLKFAISCSGTATLENAMLGIPMAILYKTSPGTFEIAKRIVKTKFIGMPNILAGYEVVPEFIQKEIVPEKITSTIEEMLDREKLLEKSAELIKIRTTLDTGNVERKIFDFISGNRTGK